jgi:hypothetical protein
MHAGPFDPVTHTVRYFQPVPLLATPGQIEGPFQRPQPGTFGNIARNSLWGPGLVNVDMSTAKRFSLLEGVNLQFTAQAFNLLNHPNLGQPSSCIDCGGSSGLINDIVASQDGTSMRRIQFGAILQF